ncbi:MAG TPA: RNA methyltransferase [Bacteroidales bacterium]|nr:RNA methyltransferase [Bacteroidales bacterium]
MIERITSLQNPLVKAILKLQQKPSERVKTGNFVAEGRREVSLALRYGVEPEWLVICQDFFSPDPAYPIPFSAVTQNRQIEVSEGVYNKLAYRGQSEGIILVGKSSPIKLSEYKAGENPLILLLEGIEKPGNLGAILRTTDAAGVDAVFLCDARTDIYNPNVIRSSLGCVFSQKLIHCTSGEAIAWLKSKGIQIIAATPHAPNVYFMEDFSGPSAIVFGAEDTGLSPKWQNVTDKTVNIPMLGIIDSLNVGTSVAIITFEAVRQRQ